MRVILEAPPANLPTSASTSTSPTASVSDRAARYHLHVPVASLQLPMSYSVKRGGGDWAYTLRETFGTPPLGETGSDSGEEIGRVENGRIGFILPVAVDCAFAPSPQSGFAWPCSCSCPSNRTGGSPAFGSRKKRTPTELGMERRLKFLNTILGLLDVS